MSDIIAIDGPAGAGKSEVVRLLSEKTGLRPLDAGSVYRAIAYIWNEDKTDFSRISLIEGRVCIDCSVATAEMIRTNKITQLTPLISKKPEVREKVLPILQSAKSDAGLIAEGRDMTTVVFPYAKLKIFLTALPTVRARRIIEDPKRRMENANFAETLAQVLFRDHMDETRKDSPLLKAKDAILIDSTDLSKELVVDTIYYLWQKVQ